VLEILNAIKDPKLHALVATMCGAGLRVAEVCVLEVRDIDSARMHEDSRGAGHR
jgi:site-specific recombinase XerC